MGARIEWIGLFPPFNKYRFGVAIDGDYAIVGAPYEDPGNLASAGSAYIFVRSGTTWSQQTKLTTQPGESQAQFGVSVDIDGDYVIVGMKNGDVGSIRDAGRTQGFRNFDQARVAQRSAKAIAAHVPVKELLVNQNDPHPSEILHHMVADSLHELLKANGLLED